MEQLTENKSYIAPRILAILLFSSFFVLFDWSYSSITILLLAFLAAVSMMMEKGGWLTIRLTFFHIWMMLLAFYCLFSAIWAWDTANALTKGKTVFSMFICYSLAYLCYQEFDSVDALLKAILWGGNIVMLIVIGTYGVREMLRLLEYGDRLSEQFYLNSNTVGVLCAMSVMINFYYLIKDKRIRWWSLFLILGLAMISATGSRQALAVAAGGLVFFCFLAMIRGKSLAEIAILILIGFGFLILALVLFSRLSVFSGIYKRILSLLSAVTGVGKTDRSATTRLALIDVGIEQFKRTPILGIGMGSGHLVAWKYLQRFYYLHNNFVEILSGGGIVGFLIYYSIYIYLAVNMILYRRFASLETAACVTLLVMALVEDYASVTYYSKETYFYLMLGMLSVEKLRVEYRKSIPQAIILQKVVTEIK